MSQEPQGTWGIIAGAWRDIWGMTSAAGRRYWRWCFGPSAWWTKVLAWVGVAFFGLVALGIAFGEEDPQEEALTAPTESPAARDTATAAQTDTPTLIPETPTPSPTPGRTRTPTPTQSPTPTPPRTPTPLPSPTPTATLVIATATATPVPPTPTPTPLPRYIPGLTSNALLDAIHQRPDMDCAGPSYESFGNLTEAYWDCIFTGDPSFAYQVTIIGNSPTEIKEVQATFANYSELSARAVAPQFLNHIATVSYQGADPDRVREWLSDSLGLPEADLYVGDAYFGLVRDDNFVLLVIRSRGQQGQ